MPITHIHLGSTNAAKLAAAKAGVASYFPDAEVTGHDVPSGVSAQPLGHEETLTGALNRARAAWALGIGTRLGLGLEGGVVTIHGTPIMMNYVAATDGTREVVIPGTGMPLPLAWGQALAQGAELRPYVLAAGLPYDYKTGVSGILSNGTLTRDEMFAEGIRCALLPWVNAAVYAEDVATTKAA